MLAMTTIGLCLNLLNKRKKDDFTTFQFPIKKVEVQFDFIIPPNKLLIISTGVSLGLMLLIVITVVLFKLGCFKRRKLTYHIQRERTKATENVKETYKSTVISNIQVQWRSKFEHLENAFNWFLKISSISNLPGDGLTRNCPKTIERTTELWKWKLSISKVDKIPLQAPTLSHMIMPCGGFLSLKKIQETKLEPVYQSRSSLIMIETLVPFQNLKLLFWRIENDIFF